MSILYIFLWLGILTFLPSEWQEHVSREGGFAIMVPGKMIEKEQMANTSTGDVLLYTHYLPSSIDSTENLLYMVQFHTVDQALYALDSMDDNFQFLELMLQDLSLNMESELLYSTRDYLSGFPVLEYRINFPGRDRQMKGKLLMNHTQFYNVQVHTTSQFALNRQMDRFLGSFRFLLE